MLCVTPPCFSPSTILPLKRSRLHRGGLPPAEIRSAPLFVFWPTFSLDRSRLIFAKPLRLPFRYVLLSDNSVFTVCHLHTEVRELTFHWTVPSFFDFGFVSLTSFSSDCTFLFGLFFWGLPLKWSWFFWDYLLIGVYLPFWSDTFWSNNFWFCSPMLDCSGLIYFPIGLYLPFCTYSIA